MEIVWSILIGVGAGFLAGQLLKGKGFGLVGNLIIGALGSVAGHFLFGLLGADAGSGLLGKLITATVGAIALLLIVNLLLRKYIIQIAVKSKVKR